MPISFKSWYDGSSSDKVVGEYILRKKMAGSDGNTFLAANRDPQNCTGLGRYFDEQSNPGNHTGEEYYRQKIANPGIISSGTKKPSWFA